MTETQKEKYKRVLLNNVEVAIALSEEYKDELCAVVEYEDYLNFVDRSMKKDVALIYKYIGIPNYHNAVVTLNKIILKKNAFEDELLSVMDFTASDLEYLDFLDGYEDMVSLFICHLDGFVNELDTYEDVMTEFHNYLVDYCDGSNLVETDEDSRNEMILGLQCLNVLERHMT